MKVYPVIPRGYCKGVVRAIEMAKKSLQQFPDEPIYILGMIVHNQFIVQALEDLGIQTIDEPGKSRLELLDKISHGVVLITAHGASDEVYQKAKQKGLKIIDATCEDVTKTHELIKKEIQFGKEILYIGKKGHPEAEGTLAIDPYRIHLIESKKDIDNLKIDLQKNYVMTNQTTMSLWDIYTLCEYAQARIPNLTIAKETCTATKIRQEAIANLPDSVDLVIIVGDPHSNNTTRLKEIAQVQAKKEVVMIESIQDLDLEQLQNKQHVAISSGASTPTYLTEQIIHFLRHYDPADPSLKPSIDPSHLLD